MASGFDSRGLVLELAMALRSSVLPEPGSYAGRAVSGDGAGGDVTFAVDALAESVLESWVGAKALGWRFIPRIAVERMGGGQILNNSPYDLAAPWLCLIEAGGVVTDGWGEPLGHRRLLGSGHEFQMSSISASNPVLHGQLLSAVDEGVARLRAIRA